MKHSVGPGGRKTVGVDGWAPGISNKGLARKKRKSPPPHKKRRHEAGTGLGCPRAAGLEPAPLSGGGHRPQPSDLEGGGPDGFGGSLGGTIGEQPLDGLHQRRVQLPQDPRAGAGRGGTPYGSPRETGIPIALTGDNPDADPSPLRATLPLFPVVP